MPILANSMTIETQFVTEIATWLARDKVLAERSVAGFRSYIDRLLAYAFVPELIGLIA